MKEENTFSIKRIKLNFPQLNRTAQPIHHSIEKLAGKTVAHVPQVTMIRKEYDSQSAR